MTAQRKTISNNHDHKLLPGERKAAISLATLSTLRVLGLFLILPVFALYADNLAGATPFLIGLAIGCYGLTQACFQIPFGLLSDRYGRKRIILMGLMIFASGSVIAALADSIWWVIIGRALQGAGAISAAALALAADLSREQSRTKVMALIGVSVGMSFALALMLGPILNSLIGVPGIFWLTALLAVMGMLLVIFVVPNPARVSGARVHRDAQTVPALVQQVLRDTQLRRLQFGIFALHLLLTALFVALPLLLRDGVGVAAERHWLFYLPALSLGVVFMFPAIIIAEKKRLLKPIFLIAIALLIAVCFSFYSAGMAASALTVGVLLTVFFTGFNYLEACLPSLIARLAPADAKGTALGVYATSQFLGAFCGGAVAGWLYGAFGIESVFLFSGLVAAVWLIVAITMRNPSYLSSYLLTINAVNDGEALRLAERLREVPGVAEAVVIADDRVAYLKVDRQRLDESALQNIAAVSQAA